MTCRKGRLEEMGGEKRRAFDGGIVEDGGLLMAGL